jgi:hypothetical protein
MFVLTADQRDSRSHPDLVEKALRDIRRLAPKDEVFGPERTVGDELQLATTDAATALTVALHLTRSQPATSWSVGIGIGPVEPVAAGRSIREARGAAFIHARAAVERAKRTTHSFAVEGGPRAHAAEALIGLLLEVRSKRTDKGWEVYDLLSEGLAQQQIAARLGITSSAVSLRAKAAGLAAEREAVPILVQVLRAADDVSR